MHQTIHEYEEAYCTCHLWYKTKPLDQSKWDKSERFAENCLVSGPHFSHNQISNWEIEFTLNAHHKPKTKKKKKHLTDNQKKDKWS